jgi:hypothetical protein
MGGSEAETIRQRRDRLTRHPKRVSIATPQAARETSASGEGFGSSYTRDRLDCPIRGQKWACVIMADMTKNQVKDILDRVLTWPAERQADVAHVVELMEEQDNTDLRLSDEQAAEVRRRLADPTRKTIAAEQVFKRFRSSSA